MKGEEKPVLKKPVLSSQRKEVSVSFDQKVARAEIFYR